MSTSELLRGDESCLSRWVGDLPGVDDDREEADEVSHSRSDVQSSELLPRSFLLFRRSPVFHLMEFLDLGSENKTSQQSEGQDNDEQAKGKAAEWPASVKHFSEEMDQCNDSAHNMHHEVSAHECLRNDSGVVAAEDAFHLFRENPGRQRKCEKHRGAEPDGRVEGSHDAQYEQHAARLVHLSSASQVAKQAVALTTAGRVVVVTVAQNLLSRVRRSCHTRGLK
jgi:hypothetical protein